MSGQGFSRQDEMAAMRFASELQKYPIEVAVGVGIVIPNLVNGCSWGFVKDTNEEYIRVLDEIKNNGNMSSFKIRGGYLFNINMDYLLKILGKVASGYVTKEDLEIASKHRQKALEDLNKYLREGNQGKIGIYNLNDTPRVVVRGVSYPAFCVTFQDLLALCVRNGYGLKLGNKVRTPGQVSCHAVEVVEKLELAPSNNAMFIEVAKLQ